MNKISRRKFFKRLSLALVSLIAIDMFWFEKYIIDWNYFDLSTSKTKVKMIQLTDLHLHSIKTYHKSIAKKINSLNPDLILITGDAIENSESLIALEEFLKLMDVSIKKYAILGNWEYWGNVNLVALAKLYKTYNAQLLINESAVFHKEKRTINIIGLDDFVGGNADILKATKHINNQNQSVILNHCPQYFETIKEYKNEVNSKLVLSGHTHGGQVNFLGFVPFKPQGSGTYLKGFYGQDLKMYVSKGIGTSLLPIRFGSRAEVAIFDI